MRSKRQFRDMITYGETLRKHCHLIYVLTLCYTKCSITPFMAKHELSPPKSVSQFVTLKVCVTIIFLNIEV